MRPLLSFFLFLVTLHPAFSSELIPIKASVSFLEKKVIVDTKPFILIKITNTTQKRLYIDDRDLIIFSAVGYSDGSGVLGTMRGRTIGGPSGGKQESVVHLHERTLGLEPGASLYKISRLESSLLIKADKAILSVWVTFPGTNNIKTNGDNWGEYEAKAKCNFIIYANDSK